MNTYNKIDATNLEVTKEIVTPTKTETRVYNRDFIERQIISITEQRDSMLAIRNAELKECEDILAEMDKKGVLTQAEANIINE